MSDRVALVVTVLMSADVSSASMKFDFEVASAAVNNSLAGKNSREVTQVRPGCRRDSQNRQKPRNGQNPHNSLDTEAVVASSVRDISYHRNAGLFAQGARQCM